MPNKDGTGPQGKGPKTGKGNGTCDQDNQSCPGWGRCRGGRCIGRGVFGRFFGGRGRGQQNQSNQQDQK